MLASTDLVELFAKELSLCRLEPGESVVVLAEPRSRSDYPAAAFAAAKRLGARPMMLTLPGGSPSATPVVRSGTGFGLQALDDTPLAVDLLASADLVIDVTVEGFIHSPVLGKILGTHQFALEQGKDSKARVLFICEPPEVLARNLPTEADKAASVEAAQRMEEAKEMEVVSAAGTELHVDLREAPVGYQCGFADEPGRWDHWPSQIVLCFPHEANVNGKVVMAPGDALFPFKAFVREPVEFTIENGRVQRITGGSDATILNRYIEDAEDPAASMTSHFGWGLSRTADWSAMALHDKERIMGMEARSVAGNFMWSTGPNNFVDRFTPYHLDFPMRDCTLRLDGTVVVEEGKLTDAGGAR